MASGIDIIEPGTESPPTGRLQIGGSTTQKVGLLQPTGGTTLNVVRTVASVVQSGQTSSSFSFNPAAVGTYQVAVTVTDQTRLVHQAMAGTSFTSSRQWTLDYPSSIFTDGFEGGNTKGWSSDAT